MSVLRLAAVKKRFGSREVLRGLTFRVEPGEVYGLLGPNGAGKSTTFNLVCNLLVPDSGQVEVAGIPAAQCPAGTIGVVAQQVALYKNLSCAENLSFFGAAHGLAGAELRDRVRACLGKVGLTERRQSLVRELSDGMQRRLHVAVGLVHRPQLVILDEPSTGLDVEARHRQWALVRSLQDEGTAVLLATHLLDEAEALCSRTGILQSGLLLAEGTPEQLRARIPAVEIALVQSSDPVAIRTVARRHGIEARELEHHIALWLPRRMELRELVDLLGDVPISSLARRPVSLTDTYVELTAGPWCTESKVRYTNG